MSQITLPVHPSNCLKDPENWSDWNHEFLIRAHADGLGEHVELGSTKQLLTKPNRPRITPRHYITKKASDRIKKYRLLRKGAEERGRTAPGDRSSSDMTSRENDEDYPSDQSDAEVLHEKEELTEFDLTADGILLLQFQYSMYEHKLAEYNRQVDSIRSMKEWVLSTVAEPWRSTACTPGETLQAWYRKLKEYVGTRAHVSNLTPSEEGEN